MKSKSLQITLSAALAAVLCMSLLLAFPVSAASGEVPASSVVTGETQSSLESESGQPTEAASTSQAGSNISAEDLTQTIANTSSQLESIQNTTNSMSDQIKKIAVEATLAVVFGFAALVLSILALLVSLRKTVGPRHGMQGVKDNSAAWKELNQTLRQMDQKIQSLAQKQTETLSAAKNYVPVAPKQEAPVDHARQTEKAAPNPAQEPLKTEEPKLRGYLVYHTDFTSNMVPAVQDQPNDSTIPMQVMEDGSVRVDENLMHQDYVRAIKLSDCGADRAFEIVVSQQTVQGKQLSEYGSLRLKKMVKPAQLGKNGEIVSRGVLEFEERDDS